MKKKSISKLRINRETLRRLTHGQLQDVAGGAVCTRRDCGYATVSVTVGASDCTVDCCTNECVPC
jgi:hypothetical protein